MSFSESGQSIAGGWLGAYYFDSRIHLPVRFEATFVLLRTDGNPTNLTASLRGVVHDLDP